MDLVRQIIADPMGALSLNNVGRHVFLSVLQNVRVGRIHVELADGSKHVFGDAHAPVDSGLVSTLKVNNDAFFGRLVQSADLGFAEGYIAGEADVTDLAALLKVLVLNRDYMNNLDTRFAWVGRLVDRIRHWRAANVVGKAQENVSAHYDLSNDLFETFLDPTMTYSCAIFESETESLEEAQLRKIRRILDKARLFEGAHLLEIGTGWGALAIEAARNYGVRVTSLTLSREQKALAEERIAAAGLSDRITVLLCDYRLAEGQYDAIVSVEMMEQVGHEFLGTFFAACERLLKPDGVAVHQVITMPDHRYDEYLKGCDYIQKHVFPGTCCPSITALINALTNNTSFVLESLENIGPHYARTLRLWDEKFCASTKRLEALGFDERFRRAWHYYFCYCQAGFATRTLGDVQMVITRSVNLRLSEGIPA